MHFNCKLMFWWMVNDYYPSKDGPHPKIDLISNFLQVTTTSFAKWLPVKLPVFYIINFSQLPQAAEYWSCQFEHRDIENDWQIKHSLKTKHGTFHLVIFKGSITENCDKSPLFSHVWLWIFLLCIHYIHIRRSASVALCPHTHQSNYVESECFLYLMIRSAGPFDTEVNVGRKSFSEQLVWISLHYIPLAQSV